MLKGTACTLKSRISLFCIIIDFACFKATSNSASCCVFNYIQKKLCNNESIKLELAKKTVYQNHDDSSNKQMVLFSLRIIEAHKSLN